MEIPKYFYYRVRVINKGTGVEVENASGVDVVEVVRCKDCKHYFADPWGWGNCVFEGGVSRRTKKDDFCSWGEWKESEKQS